MKLSLGSKIVLLVITVAVLLSGTCILVSGAVNRRTMEAEYVITADSMAATVAVMVDGDRMQAVADKIMEIYRKSENRMDATQGEKAGYDAYLAQYSHIMEDEDYLELQDSLRKIQDVSEVDCVYTLFVVPDEKVAVYLVDGAYGEDLVPPGTFDKMEESCYPYLDDLSQGIPAFITNTAEYGWVVTACAPIYNSAGEIVCCSAVDLSMNEVLEKENRFLFVLALILSGLTILICIVAIIYVRQKIIKPINMLSEAAGQYGQSTAKTSHNEFSSLHIHTGDELEILLGSMVKMERDIDTYIENLTQTRKQLSSAMQQADDMHELAHMDSLTGIRNRMAYDKEIDRVDAGIKEGHTEFGIAMVDLNFLKHINDTYGHECGNQAIKQLCRLICDVFVHSPVFRIGGDEFAVILRNNDYDKINALVEEFNGRMAQLGSQDGLEPWEKISAAIGYALFDAGKDCYAEDVFKRADQNMYERKKAMKATRK